jgi:putative transposase
MSRPLRIEWPGGLYHVTSRGDRREPIVEDDADRRAWVELLGHTCDRFNWRVHAWCLMTNHYHVVVETPEGNLCSGMRHLNGVWSQQFNRRHGRVGHVFQGRFKAIIVQREAYLLELARYVVLNPVRAGMVADAAAYAWSSHRAVLGSGGAAAGAAGARAGWLETDWLLSHFGSHRAQALQRYEDFVRAGVGLPPLWEQLRNQLFLGSEAFVAQVQASVEAALAGRAPQSVRQVPMLQRRPPPKPLAQWAAEFPRAQAMRLAFESGHYRQHEIAAHFGVSEATVSRACAARGAGCGAAGAGLESMRPPVVPWPGATGSASGIGSAVDRQLPGGHPEPSSWGCT